MSVRSAWPASVHVREVPGLAGKLYSQVNEGRGTRVIHVAGTTAFDRNHEPVGVGDMGAQVECILANIEASLAEFGAGPADVIRTRTYVTDVDAYVSEGHKHWLKFFGGSGHLPVSTTLCVVRLVPPHALVEIEAEAILD
jgi:enamine deaminase RidA (YjgF/YER057c/UK114 family)